MRKIQIDEPLLRKMIEVDHLTQSQVAQHFGCSLSCIERRCTSLGLQTQRTGPRSGDKHPGWKGGSYLVGGYRYIYSPEHPYCTQAGYVAEHRLVQEHKIGRYLLPSEVVHHINGRKLDNSPKNLQHFATNAEHLRHELQGQTPNHTPEGLAKMAEACRQSNIRRRGLKRGG